MVIIDTTGVLLILTLLLMFYYLRYCSEGVRIHSEMFNNLRVMLASEGALTRNYNTRPGASSENRASEKVISGTVGQNGRESQLVASVTPEDLFMSTQEQPESNIYGDNL